MKEEAEMTRQRVVRLTDLVDLMLENCTSDTSQEVQQYQGMPLKDPQI